MESFLTMYKITNNIELINQINQAAKLKEGNQEVNYCEVRKHPVRDEYAIPIIEHILKGYNLSFIEEVLSNLVSELPEDWEWLYIEQNIRIIIPNYLILKEPYLKALIQYCDINDVITYTTELYSYIYVNYILPEHQVLFDTYSQIKIETR